MEEAELRRGFFASPLYRELEKHAKGRDGYPESSAKRHHLVPRFLLRRFAADRDGRERVLQLDVGTGKPQWADPLTAASRTRFYRVQDDDGTIHQRVEFFLSRVEYHSANALRNAFDGEPGLSAADRATLSMFIALLGGRTHAGLERISTLADTTMQSFLAGRAADPSAFAEDYVQVFGADDAETVERLRKSILDALTDGRVRLGNPREVALNLMLQHAAASAQFVYQMDWWLVHAQVGAFVTSDSGLAMYDPTPPYPWSGHAILSSPNAETTVPLDPMKCLLIRPPREDVTPETLRLVAAEANDVTELNLRTYGFATRFIFSESQATASELRREAKRRPGSVERPRQSHTVMLIDAEPDDDRLAREHRKRGWPERLNVKGQLHDYIVLDAEDRAVERSVNLTQIGKARAVRRLGTADVRENMVALDPRDLMP